MRIGILIPEFPTQTHAFFWREIQALRSLGVEVHVLSTRQPRQACPHRFAAEAKAETHYLFPPKAGSIFSALGPNALRLGAAYIGELSSAGASRVRAIGFLLAAAELVDYARRQRIDHLHVHSCADAAHVAAMAYLIGGPRYSLHLHGDLDIYGADHPLKMRHASFVAAAARPMQQQLINRIGLPPDRTHTMWMGVDTTLFCPPPIRKRTGPLRLLTIARLQRTKGHEHALAALRIALDRGANVTYSVVGAGPHQRRIEAAVRKLGLDNQVRMLGSVDEEGVCELLRASDVFILPSFGLGEAFPVAVMEAMSCGLPVISSIIGGTPDMITDGVDGILIPQQDESALAEAIQRLDGSEELRTRLGAAARRRALEMFDYRSRARQFLEVILSSTEQAGLDRPIAISGRGGHYLPPFVARLIRLAIDAASSDSTSS
jgi:colanic acid/amylovoran biosynthesis glycosyltransferase